MKTSRSIKNLSAMMQHEMNFIRGYIADPDCIEIIQSGAVFFFSSMSWRKTKPENSFRLAPISA
jgi:hypothetical protein